MKNILLHFINDNMFIQTKSLHKTVLKIFLTTVLSLFSVCTFAGDYYAVANGDWHVSTTWSTVCGGVVGAGVPGQADNAFICSGVTVIIHNASEKCYNLVLQGGTINFDNDHKNLTVGNDMTVSGINTITGNNDTRILNVTGNLIIYTGASLDISGQTVNITGYTLTNGALSFSNATGIKTFAGSVTLNSGGSWTSTIINNSANLIFQNGITNNGASFLCGDCTFSTNNQYLSGSSAMSFAGDVIISGSIAVNNQNSSRITINGKLNGSVVGSTWNNISNSILYYGNAAQPMATGTFTAVANPNTVYYSLTGNQTIKGTTYHNLVCAANGTKTLGAITTVNGDFTIENGSSFQSSTFNFIVAGITTVYGLFGDNNIKGSSTLQNVIISGGTINGANTGNININGNLTVTSGIGTIGNMIIVTVGTTTIDGQLTISSNGGTKTFNDVIVNGTWQNSSNENITINGNLINNGTFNAGNGIYSFLGTAKNIYGTLTIPKDSVNGTYTNNNSLNVTSRLVGFGTLTQAANSYLIIGNTVTISNLVASTNPNTVEYNRNNTQIIFTPSSNTYYNLTLSNTDIKTLAANVVILGNLSIMGTAVFDVNAFDISVAGNWNNSSTDNDPFVQDAKTVTFNGSAAQNIFNTGNANGTVFNNVTVNNSLPASALTLNAAITVNGILTLQDGHVVTTAANILVLGTLATVSIGATPDSSFVKGPMIQTYNKTSSVKKIFPVGKGNNMHRADLTIKQTNTTATQYTGEFFYSSATALGYTLPATLSKVSDIDYWDINVGSANVSNASIKLYYCQIDEVSDPANLRIAKSDDAGSWLDIGGLVGHSKGLADTITSSVNFTTFSKFSFANAKGGSNSLPIELSSFDAKPDNSIVNISWSTLSEINNDYFTVEKSMDAINFETATTICGAGNSNEILKYSTKDFEPFQGVSYYRLKQTDFDGKFTYSNSVKVDFEKSIYISIYPNPFCKSIYIAINEASQINKTEFRIYNASGVEVLNRILSTQETILETSNLPAGIYSYKVIGDSKTIQSGKLISQK